MIARPIAQLGRLLFDLDLWPLAVLIVRLFAGSQRHNRMAAFKVGLRSAERVKSPELEKHLRDDRRWLGDRRKRS